MSRVEVVRAGVLQRPGSNQVLDDDDPRAERSVVFAGAQCAVRRTDCSCFRAEYAAATCLDAFATPGKIVIHLLAS